ncbi:uncharacterized protein LOC120281118 [Dioscorea cayenensis subsp. rotundata]|uniref:Uncharacterized protein LOC120281118 n=1 Tax=Dioscorea cayennensis subsp. rotundata TaxID=55577 RepID=A0AB40CVE0_DIOCR|nr:uncharacterized protein LOC120281118 [Dioscorea cayenensis subsp. rotundata]
MFKTLHINVPFVEALAHMPRYTKFLKELLTNTRKLEDVSSVTLSEECSALITNSFPKKEKDPGRFNIPCMIGGLIDEKALADLGANVLVKVDKFNFPVDFVILDVDDKVPLILGKPFLATYKTLINVKDSLMALHLGEEEVIFKIRDSMRDTMDFDDTCYYVDAIDDLVSDFVQDIFIKDELSELLEDNPS